MSPPFAIVPVCVTYR